MTPAPSNGESASPIGQIPSGALGEAATPGGSAVEETRQIDLRQLAQQLENLASSGPTDDAATQQLVELVRQSTGAAAILWYVADSTGQLAADPSFHDPEQVAQTALNQLHVLAARTHDLRSIQLAEGRDGESRLAVAVPVLRRDGTVEVLVTVVNFGGDDRRRLSGLVLMLHFVAAYAGQWRGAKAERATSDEFRSQQHLLGVLAQTDAAGELGRAGQIVADFLTERLSARWVAISTRRAGGLCRLRSMSSPYQFQRGTPLVAALEAASSEILLLPGADHDEPADGGAIRATDAWTQLRRLVETEHTYAAALRDSEGQPIGACVVVSDQRWEEPTRAEFQRSIACLGPRLGLLRQVRRSPTVQLRQGYRQLPAEVRRAGWIVAGLIATVLCVLPVPHRLSCSCEVQPVTRRYVAAPYEGRLEAALVEPGDDVTEGQVLARMDGSEIRMELDSLRSDWEKFSAERDAAVVNGDTAAAQIRLWDMHTLEGRIEQCEDKRDHLEVRSPTAGVVISGDPKKLEGARMTIGQTLLEVAPLGEMVIEVAIADEDIAHAHEGAAAKLRLESMPLRSFYGTLVRIHPRSEQRNGHNVFIGEIQLEGPSDPLRPGMRGKAKLTAPTRPLGWVLFHRAVEQLGFRLGW